MKALCIIGSPRKNGNSAILIDKIIEGLKESNIKATRFCLGNMNINYCKGCKNCYKTGKCIQNDDVNIVINELITSDIVVIASPSYWGDITGQLKVFFERNTPYSDTNLNDGKIRIPKGKKGVAVAIRAGQSEKENVHIIESIEHYFGHLGIEPIGRLAVKGIDTTEDLIKNSEELEKAYELGKNLKNYI